MINLLPPDIKQSYHYARNNSNLMRWIAALSAGLIVLVAIGTYGWINIHYATVSSQQQTKKLQVELKKENLATIQQQVTTINNDFSLVVKVLSQEVVFSKLLTKMAYAMPAGSNLTKLSITNTAAGTGLDITAETTDYTVGSQVEANLSDPANGIFSGADLVSISCSTNFASLPDPAYPCTVSIRAEFAKNNQFLFINQTGSKP